MADATVGFLFPFGEFAEERLRTTNGVSGLPPGNAKFIHNIPWAGLYSGAYKLEGSCTLDGDPVGERRVFVMPHKLGFVVAGANVGADGLFLFDGIASGKYKIIGEDVNGTTNGVIFAYVDAVPR